jgi:hypothetical protein
MRNVLFVIFLALSFEGTNAIASVVRDSVYPPPLLVERVITGVTSKECLANLTPALSTNISYMCRIPFNPPTDGRATFTFDPTPPLDRAVFMAYSGNLQTPGGVTYKTILKIVPLAKELLVSIESYTRNPSTGGVYPVVRTDAISEITRIWAANNLTARSWNVMVWVVPREN